MQCVWRHDQEISLFKMEHLVTGIIRTGSGKQIDDFNISMRMKNRRREVGCDRGINICVVDIQDRIADHISVFINGRKIRIFFEWSTWTKKNFPDFFWLAKFIQMFIRMSMIIVFIIFFFF